MTDTDAGTLPQKTLLDSFLHKKDVKKNVVAQNAQKLINLYRHLSFFGQDFIPQYNQMLLDSSPEVQMILGDFIGGQTVRQYLEFLQNQQNIPETTEDQNYIPSEGYLPGPENDLPQSRPIQSESRSNISLAAGGGAHSLKNLMQTLISMHQDESMKQAVFLETALKQLQEGLSEKISNLEEKNTVQQDTSILNSKSFQKQQQEILDKTVERLMQKQTEIFLKALGKINENAQKMAVTQTEKLMRFLEKTDKTMPVESYPASYCRLIKNKRSNETEKIRKTRSKEIEIVSELASDSTPTEKEPQTHE